MAMSISLEQVVQNLAAAFRAVDVDAPRGPRPGKSEKFLPGIGPLNEVEALRLALDKLRAVEPEAYTDALLEVLLSG
jgi:hypothetical protein